VDTFRVRWWTNFATNMWDVGIPLQEQSKPSHIISDVIVNDKTAMFFVYQNIVRLV